GVVAEGAATVEPAEDTGRLVDGHPRGLEDVASEAPLAGVSDGARIPPPGRRPEPLVPGDPLDPQGLVQPLVGIDQRREGKTASHQSAGLVVGAGGDGEDVATEGRD